MGDGVRTTSCQYKAEKKQKCFTVQQERKNWIERKRTRERAQGEEERQRGR